jgi:hypothetical protein
MAYRKPAIQVANDAIAEIGRQMRLMHLPLDVLRLHAAELVMTESAEMIDRTARQILAHGRITDSYWRQLRENLRDLHNNVLAVEPLEDMPTNGSEQPVAAD